MCTAGSSEPELIDEGIRARCVCDDRLRETDTLIVYLKNSVSLAYRQVDFHEALFNVFEDPTVTNLYSLHNGQGGKESG